MSTTNTNPTFNDFDSLTTPQVPVANPIENSHETDSLTGPGQFFPKSPNTFSAAGLRDVEVEGLVLKSLFALGSASSRELVDLTKLPGVLIRHTLDHLRAELLIAHRSAASMGDFIYQLTESGSQRAHHLSLKNTYCGAAPVPLHQYETSVIAQSTSRLPMDLNKLRESFSELEMSPTLQSNLSQAVNAGRGMFLYGPAGNGKSTIAERLISAYPQLLWIPRTLSFGGELIRLFDSAVHEEVRTEDHLSDAALEQLDRRWVLIRRPTVIVGAELTLEHLELQGDHATQAIEAPVQLKSNGGTLVIDDFGRQRVSPTDILNRWIMPLEKQYDYLTLPNGRQMQVPFVLSVVLATNLNPIDIVDDAFLRRIPFKIHIADPDETAFRKIFAGVADRMGIPNDQEAVDYLIDKFYRQQSRPFRNCQPRDILFLVDNFCKLHSKPSRLSIKAIDVAAENYFGDGDIHAG